MKLIIDICHPAHVNFFRPVIYLLKKNEYQIKITVLDRGKLPAIANNVFPGFDLQITNKHRGTIWSILFEANVLKFFKLFWICYKFKPDIGISAGSFVLGTVLKILGIPNIQFDDDPERNANLFLERITATKLYFPVFYANISRKVGKYNALKEWSYLSTRHFIPDPNIPQQLGLKHKGYIFIREVSVGTLNYLGQGKSLIASISSLFPQQIKVILSLEDKSTISNYPVEWILLREPVMDIHSLMYFSKVIISSGDSMAREGAILGVPSIYCGIREMAANRIMIEKGMLIKNSNITELPQIVRNVIDGKVSFEDQVSFREKITNEWEDVPTFILNSINSLI